MPMRVQLSALAIAFGLFACGPSDGDGHPDDSTATLSVSPATVELMIDNGVPATADYTATLTYPNGETRDVTSEVHWSVDSGYGMFTNSQVTMYAAGKTQVHALLTDKVGNGEVIVRLKNVRVDPALPADAADWFNGPDDPARAPTLVYPPADVVMPRNLGDFEVHWTDAQNDVFEISLKTEFTDVRAIVPGGNGAIANSTWSAFLAKEWLQAVSFEPNVQFEVRGVNKANPASVGSTGPQLVRLTNEQMLGGLYYWAATAANNGPYGIFRHDMSNPGQPAEEFETTTQTGGRCVACHVLSRDGSKMALTFDGGDGAATLMDVGTKAMQTSTRGWNFGTFTPDGNQFLAVQGGTLTVLEYATQMSLATMPAAGRVSHPDLSADGTKLVYVQQAGTASDWSFTGGKIMIRSYDQATRTFGPETQLVMDTSNNFYPSFSPDGKWVLFNRAPSGTSYNNNAATLWVTKSDGGTAIQLTAAAGTAGLTNSWGRWAPFQQTVGAANEPLYWVTVSSTRDFGVRLVGANRPQIWMTPFMPDKAMLNADPSAAAFRLPFQNIESNNHIAQWTEQIVAPQ